MSNTNNTENMSGEVNLNFEVKAGNVFDLQKKKKILQDFSRLDMEDQERIEQIMINPKAREALKKNWNLLKSMF
ncbi:hypothetical protein Q763_01455 [Flavobacterium beibuense F44-8]|uniref:Uncharacterized protein n=2 Tax=Flavobacterium TaxID=237 RepID=A0A0A2LYK0_9FLAO|nr:hypothetical protein [Flavobacterium beibuense]KGO84436.1 hypothetical protein Q763_01455 [Flavobacterium beibuense F44-8]